MIKRSLFGILALQIINLTGCFFDEEPKSDRYPRDQTLHLNHIQALGTHNSYHRRPSPVVQPWDYEHAPLIEQLELQGVRQFELDIHEDEQGVMKVFHIGIIDEQTTCETLLSCLSELKAWSDTRPDHHPLLLLLEVKSTRGRAEETIARLEADLAQVWGEGRLITPQKVMGNHDTLREAINAQGWPTLGELRGMLLAVLHNSGDLREELIRDNLLKNRLMFPDAYGDLEADFSAYHSMNDPIADGERISEVVRARHLVRTRSDADSVESVNRDYQRFERALETGAHWISTDYPRAPTADTYGVLIPEGTPSRCNPITAPIACFPSDIE